MPRRKLTAKEKSAMQAARITARKDKAAAAAALSSNSQFVNAKFWKSVDPELLASVEKAIAQAKKLLKQQRIKRLEKELAKLKGE